jgi:hypothetical protein
MDKYMEFVRHIALLVSLLLIAPLVSAQATKLYKWTDEQGTVHYSQIPPTERQAEVITPEAPPPAQPEAEAKDTTKPPEGISESQAANMKIKQQNCEAAQKNLRIYQSSAKVLQPDGTEITLSDEMREAKIKETQQQIKFYCE